MATVALIGGDGAGKTTIALRLLQASRVPMKYVYMGFSTRSSNHALPTSRLVLFLKRRAYGRSVGLSGAPPLRDIPANSLEYAEVKRGGLWMAARFLNRLAEAGFRQAISLGYQLRGYTVVYDRHFLFDTAPERVAGQLQRQPFWDRVYYWILSRWFPKPDLVIFLDAPADVLYGRKGEASPEYLERQRQAYLEQGKKLPHFVRVDATQPLEKVTEEVAGLVAGISMSKAMVRSAASPDRGNPGMVEEE